MDGSSAPPSKGGGVVVSSSPDSSGVVGVTGVMIGAGAPPPVAGEACGTSGFVLEGGAALPEPVSFDDGDDVY